MSASPTPPTPKPRPPGFQPRFTLMLLYLVIFFALYCFLWILPDLLEVLGSTPAGPEQEELAKQASQRALQGKPIPLFILAIATVGVGAYLKVLPGLRPSR